LAEGFELEDVGDEGFSGAGRGVEDDVTHRPIGMARFWQNAPK